MTVEEALDILNTIPNKKQQVYLSSDSEGNRYLPLANIEPDCIRDEDGEIYGSDPDLTYSDVVCVLWPD